MFFQPTVPPGPPHTPTIHSRTGDSLLVRVQLSDIGTEPIHTVFLEVTNPEQLTIFWTINGTFVRSETVEFEVTNLSPATVYTIVAYGMNAGGLGLNSHVVTAESRKTLFQINTHMNSP